jgi:hypothetical protein
MIAVNLYDLETLKNTEGREESFCFTMDEMFLL